MDSRPRVTAQGAPHWSLPTHGAPRTHSPDAHVMDEVVVCMLLKLLWWRHPVHRHGRDRTHLVSCSHHHREARLRCLLSCRYTREGSLCLGLTSPALLPSTSSSRAYLHSLAGREVGVSHQQRNKGPPVASAGGSSSRLRDCSALVRLRVGQRLRLGRLRSLSSLLADRTPPGGAGRSAEPVRLPRVKDYLKALSLEELSSEHQETHLRLFIAAVGRQKLMSGLDTGPWDLVHPHDGGTCPCMALDSPLHPNLCRLLSRSFIIHTLFSAFP
ncbi:hypothetical protein TREES_T100013321 [Tupaia chinensis]|uniref:Uncharacterized protein n=1 Tax=Tupaia chinensis TaxID=246437 RepID=L9KHI7_TUPCH|nr:hypothetical protein TREES_T100013321 [Tupaia chinensis]